MLWRDAIHIPDRFPPGEEAEIEVAEREGKQSRLLVKQLRVRFLWRNGNEHCNNAMAFCTCSAESGKSGSRGSLHSPRMIFSKCFSLSCAFISG
jgi:hypothetical protein